MKARHTTEDGFKIFCRYDELLNIQDFKPHPDNPNTHPVEQLEVLVEVFKKNGIRQPIKISTLSGYIISGHGRLAAARLAGMSVFPAEYQDYKDSKAEMEDLLGDNKIAELSEINADLLKQAVENSGLENLDLKNIGFSLDEINSIFDIKKEIDHALGDSMPADEDIEQRAKRGDIWQLGNNRLMCGDSTSRADVERLMNGQKADMVFTDPPYGMKKEKDGVLNDNLNFDDLLEFNKKWIPLTFDLLKDVGSWYCWGIDEPLMDIYSNIIKPLIRQQKATFRNLITWNKGNGQGQNSPDFRMYPIADEKCLFVMCGVQGFNNNADNYFEGWEPIRDYLLNSRLAMGWDVPTMKRIVGHSDLSRDHWTSKSQFSMPTEKVYNALRDEAERQRQEKGIDNDAFKREYDDIKREYYSTRAYFDNTHDNMNNVWHFERTSQKERELTGGHATPKPIALCARAIKSSSREGELVVDVFGGSGSTLIACEQLNRKCYTMELDEHYVDVIITRWETLTGEQAVLIESGSETKE